jgi:N-acetylmuramoyl-L-alanine amidase
VSFLNPLLEDVSKTKVRLIKGAIEDNAPRGPYSRLKPPAHRRRLPLFVAAGSLIAILAYLSTSDLLLRRVASSRTAAAQPMNSNAAFIASGASKTASPDGPAPHPLDRRVFPLTVRKVVIDAGHGGTQQGTASASGLKEKDVTLDIALRLQKLLQDASFEVVMTREADETVALERRAEIANAANADLFVSIHLNSMPQRKLRALETYFLGPTDDPVVTKLAAMENRDSGYSLSDYRLLLEKTYMDTRRDESQRFAKKIQTELHRSVLGFNPAVQDRGVKTAPFAVLIRTEMPAILAEVSCLSNDEEVKLLTKNAYKQTIAEAILKGIRSYADDLKGTEERAKNGGR